jgi:hypothetical protein
MPIASAISRAAVRPMPQATRTACDARLPRPQQSGRRLVGPTLQKLSRGFGCAGATRTLARAREAMRSFLQFPDSVPTGTDILYLIVLEPSFPLFNTGRHPSDGHQRLCNLVKQLSGILLWRPTERQGLTHAR